MKLHPLQALELAARNYDRVCRASVRADNSATRASYGYADAHNLRAADVRKYKLLASDDLAAAAEAYAAWKAAGAKWPTEET